MQGSAADLELQGKILDKKRNTETDRMMENILKHANPEWREQRSTCAKILDPQNHDKMKRRRAGVVHTNWDNVWMKWSGCQRWWEVTKDRKNLLKTAQEFCRRTLIRDVDKKKESPLLKEKQPIWEPSWENQKRIQILGDPNLIVNWINGKWEINNQKFRKTVQRTQNMLDKTGLRPVGDHLDMFQHVYRE